MEIPMKKLALQLMITFFVLTMASITHGAEKVPKVVVLGFSLNDLTDLPNAPEELKRIELLSKTFKEKLGSKGVEVLPMSEKAASEFAKHSPTYFYDHTDTAVELNKDTGADYVVIGVALKPTYLFVYPRLLMVDVKTGKVVMSKAAQLESSWSDENTTVRTGENLAQIVKSRLDLL
jgi:hypothetical protein